MNLGRALLVVAAGFLSWVGTRAVRRYALAHNLMDVPNSRSSHASATPRGGGLAIAVSVVVALAIAGVLGWVPLSVTIALVGGGTAVAVVGFIDDHGGVRPRLRLGLHFAAALWALWWLRGYPVMGVGANEIPLGPAGSIVAAIGIAWSTNFFNFMDGIDGLAGAEAITVGVAATLLLIGANAPGLALATAIIAAAAAGFLIWNWTPAKIFMGDVGSALLGYLFGVLAVASENAGAVPVVAWVMLLGVFVFDATITLIRRGVRGEDIATAHRRHAYQRLVQLGWGHGRVTSSIVLVNVVLSLLAFESIRRPASLSICAGVAGILMLTAYFLIERRHPMFSGMRDA